MTVTCTRIATERTARYYESGARESTDVWLVLHGYGQLASRFVEWFAPVATERRIIAPEGLSRFYTRRNDEVGASWMTREDRLEEIRDYVAYLDAVLEHAGVSAPTVAALGFSQGVHTACRWVATKARVRSLIIWGSTLPPDLDDEGLARAVEGAPVRVVVGDSDQVVKRPDLESDLVRLRDQGVDARLVRYDGGHEIPGDVLTQVARQVSEESGSRT